MAGGGDDDAVVGRVDIGQRRTVDARGGDGRRQVLGRMFPAGGGERAEVAEEIQQYRKLLLGREPAPVFVVVTAE